MPWGSFMPLSSVAQELGQSPLCFACGRREVWAQFGQKDAAQERGSLLHLSAFTPSWCFCCQYPENWSSRNDLRS